MISFILVLKCLRQIRQTTHSYIMVWTMWQGWNDEKNERLRVERELKQLTTLFHRVVSERDSLKKECDSLKEERDELQEENKRLRNI